MQEIQRGIITIIDSPPPSSLSSSGTHSVTSLSPRLDVIKLENENRTVSLLQTTKRGRFFKLRHLLEKVKIITMGVLPGVPPLSWIAFC